MISSQQPILFLLKHGLPDDLPFRPATPPGFPDPPFFQAPMPQPLLFGALKRSILAAPAFRSNPEALPAPPFFQEPMRQPILFQLNRDGLPSSPLSRVTIPPPQQLYISGVTKDSAGAVLGSCVVELYRTLDDMPLEKVTSDAATGVYRFSAVGAGQSYYVVAYKQGSPDVAGTTVNTLVGTV